ncbi:FAD-dependent oxidoreductase, partial [bacterium]|nr:FAD-dependent oxidoreductase [bacterium]
GASKPLTHEPLDTWAFIPPSELQELDNYLLISELGETYGVAPQDSTIMSAAAFTSNETEMERTGAKIRSEVERLFPEFNYARDTDWIACQHFNPVDGVGRTIDWYHEKRLGPKTPIQNLYIAGDTTQQLSTGTDGCASSAVLAAEEMLGGKIIDMRTVFG